ncbi:hypothetical protein BS17DRAFT_770453 [Gyrodon lividus]|nr:hypothetical protein BS17DRAFT_770453 [Gyrodon lividus]
MDATTANLVLDATAKTIVNILWGEVQGGEWDTAVERMENAMRAACTIIQHANVIPGIVIAVEQLLHPQDMQWLVCTQYKSGSTTTDQNEFSQQLEEVSGMEEEEMWGEEEMQVEEETWGETETWREEETRGEEETWGEEILQMKMEEDEEDEYIPPPTPKWMMKVQQAEVCMQLRELREQKEDNRMRLTAGPLKIYIPSSTASTMTTPTPAPTSTPAPPSPPTPSTSPVPVSATQRHGHPKSGQRPPLAGQHANACSTCINFGVLCMPVVGFSCDTCHIRKKKCKQAGKRKGWSSSCAQQSIGAGTLHMCS